MIAARVALASLASVVAMACPLLAVSQPIQPEGRARGVVRSLAEANIASELSARIVAMPFREGQSFGRGDTLVAFDCARLSAEVAAAEAEQAAAKAAHDGNREMERLKAIGARDLAISAARLDKAAADVAAGKVRLSSCIIEAPFAGSVVEKHANVHEISAPSSPLIRIVDVASVEIELIAPSRWLGWLAEGSLFRFEVDETGRSYAARVTRLGAAVDPVSQTVKLFAAFAEPAPDVRPGMSGAGRFSRNGG